MLRQQDAGRQFGLRQTHAHILARQQQAVGIRHFGTQRDLPRGGVHRQIGKQQLAGTRQLAAVFQHDAHCRRSIAGVAQLPGRQRLAQTQYVAGGLGEVDVHGVGLLDHGQLGRLGLAYQRAFGHQRLPDAPGNRCTYGCIVKVDARGLHRSLRAGQVGLGLLVGRHHVDVFLLADSIGFDQRFVAFRLRRRLGQIGLCLAQRGLRAVHRRLVNGRVDPVQRLAGLDFAALLEQALEDHAIDTGAHLRHPHRADAARQLCLQRDRSGRDDNHTDLGRRHTATAAAAAGRRALLGAAGCQQQGGGQNSKAEAARAYGGQERG